MTTATAIQTPRERILVALRRLATHQGHTVPTDRMATLAADLEPYAWPDIIAALDAHRKASRFFPQFAEVRRLLEPDTRPVGLRGQSTTHRSYRLAGSATVPVIDPDYRGAPYRFHCDHAPTCATWPDHRDLVTGGDPQATLAALNRVWRNSQGDADDDTQTARTA